MIKKHGVSESVLGRRKKGIKISGYSSGYLFECLKYGQELAARLDAQEKLLDREKQGTSPEQDNDSAQIEKANHLSRKSHSFRQGANLAEQNRDPAQEEIITK